MMDVTMFGWEFPPFSSGGLGTHCYALTEALSKKNINITFVMPSASNTVGSNFVKVIKAGNQKIIKIAASIQPYVASLASPSKVSVTGRKGNVYDANFFANVQKYNELAFQAASQEGGDVIHCHDWMTFPVGVRMKNEHNKPLVVTVHSTEFDRTGNLNPNSWITHIEWLGMYHADKIITVSNYMKNQIVEKFNVPGDKIEVIYNAVRSEDFNHARIKSNIGDKIVLFLGRITLQKGPDYFLEAARLVLEKEKNVKFVVVGKGDMLHRMIERAVELGISNNVFFTGYQPSIQEFYSMADVYVMPSVSEPFGITALEAISCGTPLIISKQAGVSEVIKHCLRVDFWDVRELANKILGVLTYTPVKSEMSSNSFREAKSLNWDDVAGKTVSAYQSVLG
jgi:glycosyltransferase involved in cell wall biosynthesis